MCVCKACGWCLRVKKAPAELQLRGTVVKNICYTGIFPEVGSMLFLYVFTSL